jgi:hypothetical protein
MNLSIKRVLWAPLGEHKFASFQLDCSPGAGSLVNHGTAGALLFVALSIRFVRFITKADDMCDELDIDLAFPAEENCSMRRHNRVQ